jgi:hypothetical protein
MLSGQTVIVFFLIGNRSLFSILEQTGSILGLGVMTITMLCSFAGCNFPASVRAVILG